MKGYVKLARAAVLLFALISLGYGKQFTDPGSCELGGTIGYTHLSVSNGSGSASALQIAPVMSFFPSRGFMLAPAISYAGAWEPNESQYQVNLGFRTGVISAISDGKSFFYLTSGVQLVLLGGSYSGYYSGSGSYDNTGYSIPIEVGFKFPVQQHIAINFGPSFAFTTVEGQTVTQFMFSWGLSGLIF